MSQGYLSPYHRGDKRHGDLCAFHLANGWEAPPPLPDTFEPLPAALERLGAVPPPTPVTCPLLMSERRAEREGPLWLALGGVLAALALASVALGLALRYLR